MNEIVCPKCNTAFKVDEASFASIVKQVRDNQFNEELKTRLSLAEKDKQSAIQLAEANIKNSLQLEISQKDKEIATLKEKNINAETQKQLEITKALKAVEVEKNSLKVKSKMYTLMKTTRCPLLDS